MKFQMLSLIATVCCSLFFANIALAQQPTDREERLRQILERFPQADEDRDGTLTFDEARALMQARQQRRDAKQKASVAPTAADVRYGEHDRNVFDLYLPDKPAASPTPVFVYFHGGGFVGGDKSGFDPSPYLDAGFAVVSGNYRFVDGRETLSPAPLLDAARVIQYLREHAKKWSLDPNRIAVSGNSAGAVIALFVGYHDDLAKPDSSDPVARQSTRVQCIVPMNGPTNLDPRWITPNMGGPPHVHGSFPKLFGATVDQFQNPEVAARVREISAVELASADDPPTLLLYGGSNTGIPLPADASTGLLIHHPFFGEHLKQKLDSLGVENRFSDRTDPRGEQGTLVSEWLCKHLVPAE